MAEASSTLQMVNTLLLAGVLVSTTMVVCSNDRLEGKVQGLTDAVGKQEGGDGGDLGALAAAIEGLRADLQGGAIRIGPESTGGAARTPGAESPITVTGWGGKRAKVRYVEGAVPNAPLRLQDKPRPQGDAWVARRGAAPSSLNYYATNEGETSTITGYSLGRLITLDPDTMKEVPNLATSWTVSDDKLTYTYTLRKGVLFADGRPFTAEDVEFSFDVMRDPAVRANHMRASFEDVISLEATDAHTVTVRYRKKYWKGIYTVGYQLRVLNKGWYQEQIPVYAKQLDIEKFSIEPGKPGFGDVFNKIRDPCPGTGPYFLPAGDKFDASGVKLVQNPFWWGIQVYPTRWNVGAQRWRFIKDEVAAFEEFRKQKIDLIGAEADNWEDEYKHDEQLLAICDNYEYSFWKNHASYVAWNCRLPPFDDKRVRLAMTHLLDRQWIVDEMERGRGVVAACNARLGSKEYTDLEPHPFDPEVARGLLAEAGWKDTDGDGVLDRDGKPFEFEFKVPSGRPFYLQVGGQLKNACAKVGIRVSIRPLEWATFIEDYYARRFDAVCLYSSWPDAWPDNFEEFHSSQDIPDGGNSSGWHNDRVDELLAAMRVEFDEAKRREMFHEFNRIFHAEQPYTLLVHAKVIVLVNNRFEDHKIRLGTGSSPIESWVKPENVRYE